MNTIEQTNPSMDAAKPPEAAARLATLVAADDRLARIADGHARRGGS